MAIDLRLARKGAGEPRLGLIQQGNYHVKLATDRADALASAGWSKEKTSSLSADIVSLQGQSAAQADLRASSKQNALSESAARNQAKTLIRKLRNIIPIIVRDHPELGVTAEQFNGGTLRDSTPKISGYLNSIIEPTRKLEGVLRSYLPGEGASSQVEKAKRELDEADTVQETSLSGIPEETLKVYEIKGRVLEAIEDINRIAKNAFDGQATISAQFNKDLLLRARQTRKTEELTEEDPDKK